MRASIDDLLIGADFLQTKQMDNSVVDDAISRIKLELEGAGMKAQHTFISGTCTGRTWGRIDEFAKSLCRCAYTRPTAQ